MTNRGRSRFLGNTIILAVATAAMTVLTLVQVKVLAGFLSRDIFGLFAALRGLSLLLAIVAANGLPQLLIRFLPTHESRGDISRAIRLSVVCVGLTGALLAVTILAAGTFEERLFRSVPSAQLTGQFHFWFYATTVGVGLKLVLFGGLNGLRRLGWQTAIDVTGLAVQVAWIVWERDALSLGRLFYILGVVSLAMVAVAAPVFGMRLWRDVKSTRHLSGPTATAGGYVGYWWGATGLSVVALAFSDVDRFLLSRVLALELLSLFHVGGRVVRLANRLLAIPLLAFQPEATRLDAEHRESEVDRSTLVLIKFNIAVSTLMTAVIVSYGPEIVRAIASADYLDAVPLLSLMALTIPMSATTAPLTTLMKARDRIGRAVACDLVWAVIYLSCLVILGRAYGLLGTGVALVAASAAQLVAAGKLGHVPLGWTSAVLPAIKSLAAAALGLAPIALVSSLWPDVSPLAKIALLPVAMVLYRLTVARLHLFEAAERDQLAALLSRTGPGRAIARLVTQ